MKKAPMPTTTPTQGANHDVTNPKISPRPTDRALHPTTPLETMISRAIDQELEWYFSYAESALRRTRVPMLPRHAVLLGEPTDAAIAATAESVARTVRGGILTIRPRHAAVLRAVYTPRTWPKDVSAAWGHLSSVAVRLAMADDPWAEGSGAAGLQRATALRLADGIFLRTVRVTSLRERARRLVNRAIVAYVAVRALEGFAGIIVARGAR